MCVQESVSNDDNLVINIHGISTDAASVEMYN